jgi:hypothetical protein
MTSNDLVFPEVTGTGAKSYDVTEALAGAHLHQ